MSIQKQVIEESLVGIKRLKIEGENFFCISNNDAMRPFFMSIVSVLRCRNRPSECRIRYRAG
jgi:hypothetical protein